MSLFKSLSKNLVVSDDHITNENSLKIKQIYKEDFDSDTEFSDSEEEGKSGDEDYSNHFGRFLLGFGECDAGDVNKEIKRRFKTVDKQLESWVAELDIDDFMPNDTSSPKKGETDTSNNTETWKSEEKKDDIQEGDEDKVEEFIKLNKELFGVGEAEFEAKDVKVNDCKEIKDTSIMNTVFSSIKSYKTAGKRCPQSKYMPNEM